MKTLESTKTRKVKVIEVKYSNMTFIVKVSTHYMTALCETKVIDKATGTETIIGEALNNPSWAANKYTATIKETGEGIGLMGGRKLIKSQMELINSKPHLFLR